ncbi:MAG: hypothetical protein WA004_17485 [Saprospiraceae bacterium]
MDNLLESTLWDTWQNRIVLSGFCLLVFALLIYFWGISRAKIKANHKNGDGLAYLSFAYLLYCVLGFTSIFQPYDPAAMPEVPVAYLVLSSLISFSLLSSQSFFSLGVHRADAIVSSPAYANGVKYLAFAWVILVVLIGGNQVMLVLENGLQALTMLVFGFFIIRYFLRRRLRFIALVAAFFFITVVLLLVVRPGDLQQGKFVHMNIMMLGPAMALSALALSYTFNWINELNFYELSNIWVQNESATPGAQQAAYSQLTHSADKSDWMERIARDELEKVIEEIIILRRHRNEDLENILNIASRNMRNNNNHLKGVIKYEDYQLNRNQISQFLIQLVQS